MHVSFKTRRLQDVCEAEEELCRAYGSACATKVMSRLSDLRAAPTLAHLRHLPGRCRELVPGRRGQIAIDLGYGRRLIFEPAAGWPEAPPATDTWAEIDSVRVLDIVDHDG